MTKYIFVLINALALFAHAQTSKSPADANFVKLPDGTDLRSIAVNGVRLSLSKGSGVKFTERQFALYTDLRDKSKTVKDHPVQWVFADLDSNTIIDSSMEYQRKIFGASSSKIFVAGTLLDKQNGQIQKSQLQLMANMLVVSSNTAWVELQRQAGNGDSNRGRQRVQDFTQRMGYARTRGFQGYLGTLHGNELTAYESTRFLFDTYHAHYPGAEILWKLMYTCRTGASRGRKYIPQNIFVGGKTGTYDGPTENPETGQMRNPDGSAYRVAVRNHLLIFHVNGKQYGLSILADTGSDESAALIAGGLIREHLGIRDN